MAISIVVAIAENGVIGRDGRLPWHLPDDLARFKELTKGHTVVMGRRTFDSIGRPLPNRRNVVLSRDRERAFAGVDVVHELADVLTIAEREDEVFVIGGGEIFDLIMPHADRIYMTLVHSDVEGDTTFTDIDLSEWEQLSVERYGADAENHLPWSFILYQRRK